MWIMKRLKELQRIVNVIEPWTVLLAVIGLILAFATMMVESEDRRSERLYRAWEIVMRTVDVNHNHRIGDGSVARQALEYLNREFNGWGCHELIGSLAVEMTGDDKRQCLLPKKRRESLANLVLKDADFREIELRRAILTNSILTNVKFDYAILNHADFDRSVINNSRFFMADLRHTRFFDAQLRHTFLHCANMSGAEMGAADMQNIIAGPAEYDMQFWTEEPRCGLGPYALDLSGADLRGVKLKAAHLAFANLTGASFGAADLSDANLYGADISGAKMKAVTGLQQKQLDEACARQDDPPEIAERYSWSDGKVQSGQCDYLRNLP